MQIVICFNNPSRYSMCISIHMHTATFSGEMCWQKHTPSTTSSSCCHHCVLVLHKDTDLLTMLNTFRGCDHWISCFFYFKGKFCIILMFLFIICDLHPICLLQMGYLLMQWGCLMKAMYCLKKKSGAFSSSMGSLWVSMIQLTSLILCCTVS